MRIARNGVLLLMVTFVSLLVLSLPAQAALSTALTYPTHDTLYTGGGGALETDLTIWGGTEPYTVTANNGNIRIDKISAVRFRIRPVTAGTTVVTVKDAAGATATRTFTVANPLQYKHSTSTFTIGEKFTVTVSGGIPPYTLAPQPANTATVKAISPNVFEITPLDTYVQFQVRDSKGGNTMFRISATAKTAFVAPLKLSFSSYSFDKGKSTQLVVSGGTPPYNALANKTGVTIAPVGSPATTTTFTVTGTSVGAAVITVSDSKGQKVSGTIEVKSTAPTLYSRWDTQPGTSSQNSYWLGTSAEMTPQGGLPPYTVTSPDGLVTITSLGNNKYRIAFVKLGEGIVRITDSDGNQVDSRIKVVQLSLALKISDGPINMGGWKNVDISGGTAPYTVVSSNPAIARIDKGSLYCWVWGVSAGTAQITATDAKGVKGQITVVVSNAQSLLLTAPLAIYSGEKGELLIKSGNPPYTVTTSTNLTAAANGKDASGSYRYLLTAGTVGTATVTVKDAKGQSETRTIRITAGSSQPTPTGPPLTILVSKDPLLVGETGNLAISGGTAPYTVTTSDSGIQIIKAANGTYQIKALQSGSRMYTVTDSKGQKQVRYVSVSPATYQRLGATLANTSMTVGGTTRLTVTGGDQPYTVKEATIGGILTITPDGGGYKVTGNKQGLAKIMVTDRSLSSVVLEVDVKPALAVAGPANLTVGTSSILIVNGGTAPYTATVDKPSVMTIQPKANGEYTITAREASTVTVTFKDSKGAAATKTITISPPKPPKLDAVASNNTIYLVPTATNRNFCIITVNGGQGNYQLAASPAIVTIAPQGKTATGSMAYAITARARGATTLTITDQSGQRTNVTIRIL